MTTSSTGSSLSRFLSVGAWFVIVVAGVKASSSIVVPFIMSIFFAVVLAPTFFWLTARRVPQGIALLLIIGVVLLVGGVTGAILGASVSGFSTALPEYQARLSGISSEVFDRIESYGLHVDRRSFQELFNPGAAMQLVANLLSELSGVFANMFLILLAVVFILLESASIPKKVARAFGEGDEARQYMSRFTDSVKQYMAIKTQMSLLTGILVTLWLWILGVDFPLLWGILAFLLNYVPNLGSIIAAVPPALLALVQIGGWGMLGALGGIAVINVGIGNFLEPRLMGRGLGLSTLVVFVSLVFWGWVLGLVGMLLSVPLTVTLKLALESREDSRWMAVLLGPEETN